MEVYEPAEAYGKRKYSLEEYIEMEKASDVKHEFYKGEIFAMAGAKVSHNIVAKNIISTLDAMLKDSPCQPYNSDTNIYIEKNTLGTYPDISVICGDPITLGDDDFSVLNPIIIFEVLSDNTRIYDKDEKFRLYQNIPTLKEYVLVEPNSFKVELFRLNTNGFWEKQEYDSLEDEVKLDSIEIALPLKEIYKKTKLVKK